MAQAITMDGAELFAECLSQATLVVKQVLPGHFANPTPSNEWDVRDLTNHMLSVLERVPIILSGRDVPEVALDEEFEDELVPTATDLSTRWQAAADQAEFVASELDLEDTITYDETEMTVEDYLLQIAGDILIHAWDLGEAIGMSVRFAPNVAEAVMETTVIPNKAALPHHNLFDAPLETPAEADLQTRLLALFGRSRSWRATA